MLDRAWSTVKLFSIGEKHQPACHYRRPRHESGTGVAWIGRLNHRPTRAAVFAARRPQVGHRYEPRGGSRHHDRFMTRQLAPWPGRCQDRAGIRFDRLGRYLCRGAPRSADAGRVAAGPVRTGHVRRRLAHAEANQAGCSGVWWLRQYRRRHGLSRCTLAHSERSPGIFLGLAGAKPAPAPSHFPAIGHAAGHLA